MALAAVTAAVYAPTASFDFLNYEDINYVANNLSVQHGTTWAGVKWAFQTGYQAMWQPLTWITYMLDIQAFGLRPGPMHVVNAALHIVNSILLFEALRSLTGRLWRSALVAALFAWHPMHVESVAWISERKDVLSGLFFMLALWAYAGYAKFGQRRPGAALACYFAALAMYASGLMSKPAIITLPFIFLLLDAWPLRRVVIGGEQEKKRWHAVIPSLILEKLPFFALAIASSFVTIMAEKRGGAVASVSGEPLSFRLLNALASYFRYTERLALPHRLSIFYPFGEASLVMVIAGAVLLALGCWVAVREWNLRPYLLVGWLWFVGSMVPVIGIVQIGGESMADRFTYLPAIGLFIIASWLGFDWIEARPKFRPAAIAAAAAALAACLFLTQRQVMTWRDGGTAALQGLKCHPRYMLAHAVYADFLVRQGRYNEAEAACQDALKIDPRYGPILMTLGDAFLTQGNFDKAAECLERAARLSPERADVLQQLSNLYITMGKGPEAEAESRAELMIVQSDPWSHWSLARALALQGRYEEAIPEFERSLQISYAFPDAHCGLADALAAVGRAREAISEYEVALKFRPGDPQTLSALAWILATSPDPALRDGPNAVALAQYACKISHNRSPAYLNTLSAAYAETGHFDDALAAARQAHDLALSATNNPLAAKSLELAQSFAAHRPYRDVPPGH